MEGPSRFCVTDDILQVKMPGVQSVLALELEEHRFLSTLCDLQGGNQKATPSSLTFFLPSVWDCTVAQAFKAKESRVGDTPQARRGDRPESEHAWSSQAGSDTYLVPKAAERGEEV